MSQNSQSKHECHYAEKIGRMADQVAEIHKKLFVGNGQPSVMVRVDRLEQAEDRRMWMQRAILGTVIVSVISSVWALFGVR